MKSLLLISLLMPTAGFAASPDERGLLPEIRRDDKSESENDRKTLQSEILITKAENQAIASLQSLLKKKAGTREEPDLLYRLAELYMRRSKTGRFFDLVFGQNGAGGKLALPSSFPVPKEKGSDSIKKAIEVYTSIEKRFPSYGEMDSVLFNNAFAHQQLGRTRESETLYAQLIEKHPSSPLIPDASVALGELAYDQRRFAVAMTHLARVEKYPESRVRVYALYKSAWAAYNMQTSDVAVEKLTRVLELSPAAAAGESGPRQSLRREALRDLAVFVGDSRDARELYPFFKKMTSGAELGQSMLDLAKLYSLHSRQKEMGVFLGEFIAKNEDNPHRLRAVLQLVEAKEVLKDRAGVLQMLNEAAELCAPSSLWRARQDTAEQTESCGTLFPKTSLEMAGKWWDIWQKNKGNAEFAGLTEKAFELVLRGEDPLKPDLKTHFAYAELLFQLGRFTEASEQYHLVGEKEEKDAKIRHDADYGALFALDKALEKKKDIVVAAQRQLLAETYLKRHPQGDQAGPVRLKLAQIAYEESRIDDAVAWARPLITSGVPAALREKAEDLDLDVLNLKKDFAKLEEFAARYAKPAGEERRKALKQIEEEARYAALEIRLKDQAPEKAALLLKDFAQKSSNEKLVRESLWRSLSLAYSSGRPLQGAEASLDFAKKFPRDGRTTEALNEAVRGLSEAGRMSDAAELLQRLAADDKAKAPARLELAADFLRLERRGADARRIYENLLPTADGDARARLYEKIFATLGEGQTAERAKIEAMILQRNVEPFATRLLVKKANTLFENGQATDTFELSRKIMSREAPADLRADARLIQARILESEFLRQSMKSTREEKFALVLALKTEKLEKAQSAFLGVSKMAARPETVLLALQGIDRCLAHYIESLEHLAPPASLSDAEAGAFKTEMAKLVVPLRSQREANLAQIKSLSVKALAKQSPNAWEHLAVEAPAPVPLRLPAAAVFKAGLPPSWEREAKILKPLEKADYTALPAKALQNSEQASTRALGLLQFSLVAEHDGLLEKALWLVEAALRLENEHPVLLYQKARLHARIESTEAASADFAKLLDTSIDSTELRILRAHRAFSEGDFAAVSKFLSGITLGDEYDRELGVLRSESLAALGEPEKALRLLDEMTAKKAIVEVELQKARLNEVYKIAPVPALESYQKALKLATDPKMKDWLVRKTEYLKINFKVGLNVTSAD